MPPCANTVAAGLTPLLVVTRAPTFAEAPHRWPYAYPGSWAPNPTAFGEFATAVARRYDGSFPDPAEPDRALPRVRLYEAWNEPNLARYLEPQWVAEGGRWRAFSPLLYRQLLNAFYAAVKAVEPGDRVIATGVAPNGEPTGVGRMTPVRFLREMLCLEGGRDPALPASGPPALRRARLPPTFLRKPRPPGGVLAGRGHRGHRQGDRPARAGRARRHRAAAGAQAGVGDRAQLGKRAPSTARRPAPPAAAVDLARATPAVDRGRRHGRVAVPLDPYPGTPLATSTGSIVYVPRPAGLYSAGVVDGRAEPTAARPKPFLRGFAFPFDPLRVDRRHVRVWALLMRPGQRVLLQRLMRGGRWRTVIGLRANRSAVLNALIPLRGVITLRVVSGGLISASVQMPRDQSRL